MRAGLAKAIGCAAIGLTVAAGSAAADAERTAVVDVACNVAALAGDMAEPAPGTTLSLAPGCVYRLTQGLPVVKRDLTIDGHHATLERSYAPGTPAFTILRAIAGAVTISDVNFRHGNGAIAVRHSARLAVHGGVFSQNTAAEGAAIDDRSDSDGPEVDGVTFTANSASDIGGAIFNNSLLAGVHVTGSTFIANTAAAGGAIYDYSVNGQRVTDSAFSRNTADACGALCLFSASSIRIIRVIVRANKTTGGAAGIAATASQRIDVEGSQISDNDAGGLGGGLYLSAVDAAVTGTTLRDNSASDGAGLYATAARLRLTKVTISGNHATGNGGGVYNNWAGQGGPSAHVVRNSVIEGNSAGGGGGGIYDIVSATFTVTASTVAGNWPDDCEPAGSVGGCTG